MLAFLHYSYVSRKGCLLPVFSVPAGINETATIETPAMIIKATVVFFRPNLKELNELEISSFGLNFSFPFHTAVTKVGI